MASAEFLNSPRGTITLVQGPPGTVKTSLLIATICKFLESRQQPRLLVCAPSNKAVTVLASRYLEVVNKKNTTFCAALVGDKDKIMSEDHLRFKDIFVYGYLSNILKEVRRSCHDLTKFNVRQNKSQMDILAKKLCENIRNNRKNHQACDLLGKIMGSSITPYNITHVDIAYMIPVDNDWLLILFRLNK